MKTNVINITIFTRHCVRGREEEERKKKNTVPLKLVVTPVQVAQMFQYISCKHSQYSTSSTHLFLLTQETCSLCFQIHK